MVNFTPRMFYLRKESHNSLNTCLCGSQSQAENSGEETNLLFLVELWHHIIHLASSSIFTTNLLSCSTYVQYTYVFTRQLERLINTSTVEWLSLDASLLGRMTVEYELYN